MSTKTRSDALRKLLAERIEQSAATPAPLTITGVGAGPEEPLSNDEERPVKVMTPDSRLPIIDRVASSTAKAEDLDAVEVSKVDRDQPQEFPTPAALQTQNASVSPTARNTSPGPAGEKLSVLLGPRDLAILERFHEDARGAGIKMRKGGNPSLFVRAALRLLDDVGTRNADDWAQIVASTLREAR